MGFVHLGRRLRCAGQESASQLASFLRHGHGNGTIDSPALTATQRASEKADPPEGHARAIGRGRDNSLLWPFRTEIRGGQGHVFVAFQTKSMALATLPCWVSGAVALTVTSNLYTWVSELVHTSAVPGGS